MRLDTMGALHAHINALIDAWHPSTFATDGAAAKDEVRDGWRKRVIVVEEPSVHGLRVFVFKVGAQQVALMLDDDNNVVHQDGKL